MDWDLAVASVLAFGVGGMLNDHVIPVNARREKNPTIISQESVD